MSERAAAYHAFCAAYRMIAPNTHPDAVEDAWRSYSRSPEAMRAAVYGVPDFECASSGLRILMNGAAALEVGAQVVATDNTSVRERKPGERPIGVVTRILDDGLVEVAVGVGVVPIQVHDEIILPVAGPPPEHDSYELRGLHSLTNTSAAIGAASAQPAWRCVDKSCPERAPARAMSAPTCYTCARPMAKVADAGDLLLSRDGDLLPETGGIERLKQRVVDRLRDSIYGHEDKLSGWMDARRAWGRELREKREWFIDPDVGVPLYPTLDIAVGEQLDEIGKLCGILRRQVSPAYDERGRVIPPYPEPDVDYRERIRAAR